MRGLFLFLKNAKEKFRTNVLRTYILYAIID